MTTAGNLKIVMESPADAQIVQAILGDELTRKSRFFAAQGQMSLATIGRNLLVHEGGPILLVMDSETLDPHLTAERESLNRVAMSGAFASGGRISTTTTATDEGFQVFTFVPEIEVVLFEAPEVLSPILGKALSKEILKEGLLMPRRTLSALLKRQNGLRDYQTLFKKGDLHLAEVLAASPQARALKVVAESLLSLPAQV